MAFQEKKQQLEESIDFGTILRQKLDQPPQEAVQVQNAFQVGGYDSITLFEQGTLQLRGHTANTANPHNVVLDVPSKETIDDELELLLEEGVLPISRYGSLSYLPINVVGAAEGNADIITNSLPMVIEKDGSLVYLRLATNGEKRDLYYAYIEGLTQNPTTELPHPTYTTRKYRPAGFPENAYVKELIAGYNGVVAGVIAYENGVTPDSFFVSITNGTMDDTQHKFLLLTFTGTEYSNRNMVSIYRHNHPTLGDRLFLLENTPFPGSQAAPAFRLFKSVLAIDVANVGDSVTWTEVAANWEVSAINNVTSTQAQKMRFSTFRTHSSDIENTLILTLEGVLTNTAFRQYPPAVPFVHPSNGQVRFVFTDTVYFYVNNVNRITPVGFSFVVDPAAGTAAIDNQQWPLMVDQHEDGSAIDFTGDDGIVNRNVLGFYSLTKCCGVTSYGNRLITIRGLGTDQPSLSQFELAPEDEFTTIFDAVAINTSTNIANLERRDTTSKYTSAVGRSQRSFTLLTNQYGVLSCAGVNDVGEMQSANSNDSLAFLKADQTSYSYTYTTDANRPNTYSGVTPENPRRRLTDMGLDYRDFTKLIQFNKVDGTVVAHGGWFAEGVVNSVPRSIDVVVDPDPLLTTPVVSAGRISCNDSVMIALKNAIILAEGYQSAISSKIELCYFHPATIGADIPSFAVVSLISPSNVGYFVLYQVTPTTNIVGDNITITGLTLDLKLSGSSSVYNVKPGVDGSVHVSSSDSATRTGAIVLHEFSDCYFLGGASLFHFQSQHPTANIHGATFRMVWDKTGGDFKLAFAGQQNPYDTSTFYWACPGNGVGYLMGSGNFRTDGGTKTIFTPYAKSRAEINLWSPSTYGMSAWCVVAAAKQPEDFVINFPDIQPVMIAGKLYQLPPTQVDLTSVQSNPANTTFYVFVELEEGEAKYVLETVARADTIDSIYIGKLVTDATSIVTVDLRKVTKIAEYRLSTTACGLGIPVSTGGVEVEGHIQNLWLDPDAEDDLENLVDDPDLNGLEAP